MSEIEGVDDLYGLALDRFVPERTALARALRSAGRREEASQVAALRKPSVAAWAVNQLVRTQRRAFDELLEAGDALRAAHDDVLGGRGDAESLRSAVARERGAVDTLSQAARGLLSSEGHELSPTILDRVSDTLHAAALDDDACEQVREGRLERELRHVGLGTMAAPSGRARKSPAPRKAKAEPKRTKDEKAVRAAAEERTRARAEARAAEREARRRAERAVRAAEMARERRDRAAQALEEAAQALAEADRERAEAEGQLQEAERAVRDLA